MASRQPNSSPPGPRRRPSSGMPSGWVWVMILAIFVVMWWVMNELISNNTVPFSDFEKLVDAGKVASVKFSSDDKIEVELKDKDANDLPEGLSNLAEIKKRIHDGKFITRYLPNYQTNALNSCVSSITTGALRMR